MADFEALNAKYMPVIDTVKEFEPYGPKFVGSELDGEQLHLVAEVPSCRWSRTGFGMRSRRSIRSMRIWKHEITNTGGAEQHYTAVAGDNLSKVSKLFYGNPNHYMKIAEASGKDDPNILHVGEELVVPVLD